MIKSFLASFTVQWLKLAAQIQLMKTNPTVIGVTGSSGKTSCVQAIKAVLFEKDHVKVAQKGNSETGIPMEILGIKVDTYTGLQWVIVCVQAFVKLLTNWEQYEVLILEMGIDSDQPPKNMSHLLSIVKPHIGVLLSISAVHGQNFSGEDTLQSIANEKGRLLTQLGENDFAIYSLDYPQIVKLEPHITAHKSNFSIQNRSSDLLLTQYEISLRGTTFHFLYLNKQFQLYFPSQLHFKESFGTFASAILVGLHFDIPIGQACALLSKHFQLPPGRMNMIEGINHSLIIDSSYNSSLAPTTAALRMIESLPGKKIVVLGDMRELGKQTQPDHEALAQQAALSADDIYFIGPLTTQYALPELQKLHFPMDHVHHFLTAYQAIDSLQHLVKPHDIILVKGSQNTILLEIIVKALMKNPKHASKLLARQTAYWEKQRQQIKKQSEKLS